METYASLVWTYRAVHLHTVASVHLDLAFVVQPRYSEYDDSFRFYDSFKDLLFHKIRVLYNVWGYTFENFAYGLMELLLIRVSGCEVIHESVDIILCISVHVHLST